MGKPIFGRNRDPTVVLASGHFHNWLEVAANYYTSQIAITSMKNQSYCECMCVCMTLYLCINILYVCMHCICVCMCECKYVCFGHWIYSNSIVSLLHDFSLLALQRSMF